MFPWPCACVSTSVQLSLFLSCVRVFYDAADECPPTPDPRQVDGTRSGTNPGSQRCSECPKVAPMTALSRPGAMLLQLGGVWLYLQPPFTFVSSCVQYRQDSAGLGRPGKENGRLQENLAAKAKEGAGFVCQKCVRRYAVFVLLHSQSCCVCFRSRAEEKWEK